jgi:hypothetical protein
VRGEYGNLAFQALREEKDAIDAELSIRPDWESDGGKHRVRVAMSVPDLRDPRARVDIKVFFGKVVNEMVNAFRPRLSRIASEIGSS